MFSIQKPITIIALVLALVSVPLNWYWPWGLLMLWWAYSSVRSGETYFVETTRRDETPILFWLINAMWIGFALMAIAYDLYPELMAATTN